MSHWRYVWQMVAYQFVRAALEPRIEHAPLVKCRTLVILLHEWIYFVFHSDRYLCRPRYNNTENAYASCPFNTRFTIYHINYLTTRLDYIRFFIFS